MLLSAALASVSEAVKAMPASSLPSPWLKLSPLVVLSVRTPFVLVSVTDSALVPTSGSAILSRLDPLNPTEPSSLMLNPPGTVWTGASLTVEMLMARVCVLELSSPSLTVNVTVRCAVLGAPVSVFW